jgi:hypothetical protein
MRILAAGAVLLAACHGPARLEPVPSDFALSPFRQPAETIALPLEDQEAIYRTVLHFYRPAGSHVRWLDGRLLPATPDGAGPTLDRELALRLVQQLGPSRFCLREEAGRCEGASGGVLRVSTVYCRSADEARLVVEFLGVAEPFAPATAYSGTQVFLVERRSGGWRIRAHEPARP